MLVKIVLTAVILYFLVREITRQWPQIAAHNWQIGWGYMLASVVVALVALVIIAGAWKVLIGGFGNQLPLRKCFRVFYLADLGRYVPGRVMALVGVLYLAGKEGVTPERATASFILHQVFCIPLSFLVFALAIQFEPRILVEQVALLGQNSALLIMLLTLAIVLAVVIWPGYLMRFTNWMLRVLHRPEIEFALDKTVALRLVLLYFLGWLCYGAAFYLFVCSVAPQSGLGLLAGAGIYNAAYQVGYVAIFAPGGFGPRELVMGFMLAPFVGPIGPAVAVLARLWTIVIEVIAALIALGIRK